MRVALPCILALLLAPIVAADGGADGCEPEHWTIGGEIAPTVHAGIETDERECGDYYSYQLSIIDPLGRNDVSWYDDERGVGIDVTRAPRFFLWTEDERGCMMVVYLFGAIEQGCPIGPPPPPPHMPL